MDKDDLASAVLAEVEALFNLAVFDLSGNPRATTDRILRHVERFVDSGPNPGEP